MKPAPFRYARPESVSEALELLASDPDAKVLAGGQNLVTLMNMRLARPSLVVDVTALEELHRSFDDDGQIHLGALTTHHEIVRHPLLNARMPVLPAMAARVGHVGIRHRGTLGGTLAHADPAAEIPAAMVLLGAQFHTDSVRGRRTLAAREFFLSHYESELESDELLTWVTIPDPPADSGWGFVEHAPRPGDYAIAGVGALVSPSGAAQAGLLAVDHHPVLVETESLLAEAAGRRRWAEEVASGFEPSADDPDYVRDVAANTLLEAIAQAEDRLSAMNTDTEVLS